MNELEIKRKANDFLHKGKYQEAVAEYENLLQQQKKPNPAILNLIGDLHVKQGDFEKGFEAYLTASRCYAEEGLFHNGIAVGKKVLRLDKEQTEVYGMLGQLYFFRKVGNMGRCHRAVGNEMVRLLLIHFPNHRPRNLDGKVMGFFLDGISAVVT